MARPLAPSVALVLAALAASACGGGTTSDESTPSGDCPNGVCAPGATTSDDGGLGPDGAPIGTSSALAISLVPPVVTTQAGTSVDVTIQVARPTGLHDLLAVTVAPLPGGVTALTAPVPVDATASSFRLNVIATAIPGNYPVGVTVQGGGATATANLALTIEGAPGALDVSFGNQGKAATPVVMRSINLGLQPSGRIVLLGADTPGNAFVAAAFDASGKSDTTFGTNGRAALPVGNRIVADARVLASGALAAGGASPFPSTMWMGRLDTAGAPDTTFGTNGVLAFASSGAPELGASLVEASDHGLLLAGHRAPSFFDPTTDTPLVVRVTPASVLDTTFGTTGRATLPGTHCSSAALDAQGRIVCAGSVAHSGGGFDLFVGRLTSAGALDTSFAAPTGWLRGSAGLGANVVVASAVQADGKIVVVSRVASGTGGDLVVTRFDGAGLIDTAFGQNGKVSLDLGSNETLSRVAFDSKGRIVLVGASATNASSRALVVRLSPSGVLDTTFGEGHDGITRLPYSTLGDFATGVAVLPDDRILVGGHSAVSLSTRVAWVARLWN